MDFNVKYSNILFIVYLHICKCKNLVKMASLWKNYIAIPLLLLVFILATCSLTVLTVFKMFPLSVFICS